MTLTRRFAVAGLGAAAAGPAIAKDARLAPATVQRIDALCRGAVSARTSAGVAVQVQRSGHVLFARGYGAANLETGTSATPNSIFRVGSISKQFAAAALLALAEAGKLSLDDPLSKVLPDFPRGGEVPIRRLLNHTSGLRNITQGVVPWIDYSTTQIAEIIKRQTPLYGFTPGTAWAYSNTGFTLAGAVIEKVSGQRLQRFYAERLFARAGMMATAFDDTNEVVPGRASGYTPSKAAAGGFVNAMHLTWTIPGAAGGLRSSAPDLCRWHDALFHGRVLSAKSVAEMTTPSRLSDGRLASAGRTGPAEGTQPDQEYGLGLELSQVARRRRVGHWGSILGYGGDMGTFPELGVTVAVLTNTDFGPQNPPRGVEPAVLSDPLFRA